MTVANAKKFIQKVQYDNKLRAALNTAVSSKGVYKVLEEEELSFSPEEFVEAHSYLLARSSSPEIEEDLRLLDAWWQFLSNQAE